MKKIALAALVALFSVATTSAYAGAQQEKMKECNKQAEGKKGDERKAFMKQCLSKEGVPAAAPADKKAAQQEKMKACNKDAGEKKLKGDDRKKFMSDCLKG